MKLRSPKMTQVANIEKLLRDYNIYGTKGEMIKTHKVSFKSVELLSNIGVIQKFIGPISYRLYRCSNSRAAAEHIVFINYYQYLLDRPGKIQNTQDSGKLNLEISNRINQLKSFFDLDYHKIHVSDKALTHKVTHPLTRKVLAAFSNIEDYTAILPVLERIYGMKLEGDLSFLIKTKLNEKEAILR